MRFAIAALCSLAATGALATGEDDIPFAQLESIPPHVRSALTGQTSLREFSYSNRLNPFIVQGDFDGDGRPDAAILIRRKDNGKTGIAVFHSGSKTIHILGAGRPVGNGGDDFSWMDAWYVYGKGLVERGAQPGSPPRLRGDALMVIKTESASGLIYWSGTGYRWYQQGD
ncbi:MAG TPA: hypothetical protein PKD04_06735 [Rhodocyclaceae bacterium]|nr:hypothetical protein [Rhodocyclaceae bacterium]HMV21009.1 hypothetical protein [Rhodocyclaceae bacterium]HNE43026.1 hypothetical protein [Rhodocyclaceae bacterium]HNL21785.1 hypothetical protein [Rhodocyclaceae bacterium]HNM23065.1 hypothetical protein [Rhodocyclaceae bacterium]